ncbi:Com family DNA-binding transcriptional regulator [Oleomonas cavernae]|uniref:Com family DNA-binding transcriptional regulator n=1 Tax=Oleomonas cavernae TaxID=2320859 RepID=A0A418WU47_9PROT|nr:Com family DNA-binding transcriptional regulator [Oleomonas cavernae]
MRAIRCCCNVLLFRAAPSACLDGIEIKCRRCGLVTHFRATSPTPERPRASADLHEVGQGPGPLPRR